MDTTNPAGQPTKDSVTGLALGTIVSASAAPYGYTVSVWSSGAIPIRYHSNPTVGDVSGLLAVWG